MNLVSDRHDVAVPGTTGCFVGRLLLWKVPLQRKLQEEGKQDYMTKIDMRTLLSFYLFFPFLPMLSDFLATIVL